MKTTIYLFCIIIFSIRQSIAQNVGINSTGNNPNTSAGLDIDFTDKGVLIPRVQLVATNNPSPVTSPADALLVFNTATAGTSPNNVVPGFYYWQTDKWIRLGSTEQAGSSSGSGTSQSLPGSGGTINNTATLVFVGGQSGVRTITLPPPVDGKIIYIRTLNGNIKFKSNSGNQIVWNNAAAANEMTNSTTPHSTDSSWYIAASNGTVWYIRRIDTN